jgi:microcystin-dependent protein
LPAHNQALAGDTLTVLTLNYEWRKFIAAAIDAYLNQSADDEQTLDNIDLLYEFYEDLYSYEEVGVSIPVGVIQQFAGSSVPSGFLLCDGSAVSRATYADLFAVIGTTYGTGNGSTTFNLPDLRGRAPIGAGQGSGLTNRALGAKVGAETHQLATSEMPSHTHDAGLLLTKVQATGGTNTGAAGGSANGGGNFNSPVGGSTASAGGGGAHNNMQPSLVCNFIIKI